MRKTCNLTPFAIAAAMQASAAFASDESPASFDLSATVTAVSDYRYRGVSLSDRDPALQASVDLEHQSGVYASLWASSIAETGGAHVEVDATLGYQREFGLIDVDVGAVAYLYPDGENLSSYELFSKVGASFGPARIGVGAAYAPQQPHLGGDDNLYLSGEIRSALPGTPFSIGASIGHEGGAFAGATGKKWDWGLSADWSKGPYTIGIAYADTDVRRAFDTTRNARAGVVISASLTF